MKENEIRQSRRFRNHISVILEQTGAVIAAVFVLVVTQLSEYRQAYKIRSFFYYE